MSSDQRGLPSEDVAEPPRDRSLQLTDISLVGRLLGKVIAPVTLLTALLFYFGWSFAYWFFDYLGVHSTLLSLTSQDFLM